jgi:hypothetical protein
MASGDKGREQEYGYRSRIPLLSAIAHLRAFARGRGLLVVLALLLGLSSPAAADRYIRELPPAGGRGDYAFNDVCKDGYLIGFKARLGAWMDQIQMICSVYEPGKPWQPRVTESYGGNGGTPDNTNKVCPEGRVLSGITLRFTKDFRQIFGIYGRCRDIATGKNSPAFVILPIDQQQAETEDAQKTYTCSSNEAAAGISGRYGKHVNAIGLNCAKFPPPDAVPPPQAEAPPPKPIKTTGRAKGGAGSGPSAPPGLLVCHTGGNMKPFGTPSGSGSMLVTFEAAPQAADVALPGPGQCAWDIVPVSASQPKRVGLSAKIMAQIGGIQSDTIFKVHASTMSAFLFATGDVEIVADGGSLAAARDAVGDPGQGGGAGEPAQGGEGAGGGMAAGIEAPSSGCPAGMATVNTPAGLDFLNVREGPSSGAQVVAQVPNGSQVTVSGSCINPVKGAGFAKQTLAPKQGGGDVGAPAASGSWCRISAPDQGCVSAQFLVFPGDGMAAGMPVDPAKGAGFAKQTPKAQVGGGGFGGDWNADADGVAYKLHLDQVGSVVKGGFTATDGSKGTILGNVSGKTLRFAWVQTNDGQTGSGKFVLAADGRSFSGSYNFQPGNFDKAEGQWNGTRK